MNAKLITSFFVFILMLLMVGCGTRAAEMSAVSENAVAPAADAFDSGGFAFEEAAVEAPAAEPGSTQLPSSQPRLIIRTADMSIIVTDTDEAMDRLAKMATDNGGWVVNSSVYQYSDTAKTGNITLRVPAEGFDSAIDAISAMSIEVTNLSTSGQDVTEEFVDLSARLENLEATAVRVRSFLEDADTVEEALAVNQELSRLEGEIESFKGRIQYLSQSAAFSTISINITPDELSQPIEVGGWRPSGIVRDALEALVDALQGLATFAIWLVIYFLPIALIIGIPLWLVVRFVRRRGWFRRNQAATAE
ncbi:MAG: DUF4349 domain-containing protein [Ardenticatenaceae bacterium]|nr:DUF4349 domain-containing protein [Ardenticatenaceae bacterium]